MQNCKCVVVGDGAVGKTCLLISYSSNAFPGDYVPTVFDNYSANTMYKSESGNVPFNLNLWDTAGQEDYSQLRPLSYPMTDVFLLCFSVISRTSYNNVESSWIPEIRHYMPHAPIVLVGTKIDLRNNKQLLDRLRDRKETPVMFEEGKDMMERNRLDAYCEVSALTQEGLPELFQTCIKSALHPKKKNGGGGKKKNASCALL